MVALIVCGTVVVFACCRLPNAGCQLLAVRCWLLVVRCWFPVVAAASAGEVLMAPTPLMVLMVLLLLALPM